MRLNQSVTAGRRGGTPRIEREISRKARSLASQFPVVSITGPRQSGKSTLVKALFPTYSYVSLEGEDWRAFAADDPRGFLARFGRGTVINEAQRVPSLFSYLQGYVDQTGGPRPIHYLGLAELPS